MAENVRSGWSNLLLLTPRKNVVKGSYRERKADIKSIKAQIENYDCFSTSLAHQLPKHKILVEN